MNEALLILKRQEAQAVAGVARAKGEVARLEHELARIRRAIISLDDSIGHLTVKAIALKAVQDYYPDGASLTQITEFINSVHHKRIASSSVSPQLSRLKQDGKIHLHPDRLWHARELGK